MTKLITNGEFMKVFVMILLMLTMVACAPRRGKAGLNGSNGVTGPQGIAGNNGSVITRVQFCPGTGAYPSVFPEVGLLIDGHLYAVYSSLGGYLFEVLPGNYASNSIGNSCSFTVNSDLSITN